MSKITIYVRPKTASEILWPVMFTGSIGLSLLGFVALWQIPGFGAFCIGFMASRLLWR